MVVEDNSCDINKGLKEFTKLQWSGMYTWVMGVFRSSFNPTNFEEFKVEKLSVSRESAKEDLSEVSSMYFKQRLEIYLFRYVYSYNTIALYAMLFCRTAEI